MPFPITAVLAAGQIGMSLLDTYLRSRDEKRRRRVRASYFDRELKPLLNEITNVETPDFNAIREAELENSISQMQNQMEKLSSERMGMTAKSGFGSSGFIDRVVNKQEDMLATSMDEKLYQTNRMIQEMQSQFDDMINQNKLRARELEYSYKYG